MAPPPDEKENEREEERALFVQRGLQRLKHLTWASSSSTNPLYFPPCVPNTMCI